MDLTPPIADLLRTLETLSGGKLIRHEDVAFLLDLARRTEQEDVLAELGFHAKFVTHASRAVRRVGSEKEETAAFSNELQKELETIKTLVMKVLAAGSDEDRGRFEKTYFRLTPDALQNLLDLCLDFRWYKNWLLDNRLPRTAAVRRSPIVWRSTVFVIVLGAIVWLGALHARAIIANDLLASGTLTLNDGLTADVERHLYRLLALFALFMIGGYLVVLGGSVVFLVRSPFRLREHGWLMTSAILLYVFVPVEVFTMVLDTRMILLEFTGGGSLEQWRELFLERVQALAGAPLVALLCYYTIVLLAAVQPFRRLPDKRHEA